MTISDIKIIKELSWYLTIPLFTCASIVHSPAAILENSNNLLGFLWVIIEHCAMASGGLLITFIVYLVVGFGLENKLEFPVSLAIATIILSISAVGLMLNHTDVIEMNAPLHTLWFVALASLSFNFYELSNKQRT